MSLLDLFLVGLSLGAGGLLLLDCRRKGKCGNGACANCPITGACAKRITRRKRIRHWLRLRLRPEPDRSPSGRKDLDRR